MISSKNGYLKGTVQKVSDFRVFKNILGRFLVVIVAFCDRLKLILNHFTENKKVSDFVHHSEIE